MMPEEQVDPVPGVVVVPMAVAMAMVMVMAVAVAVTRPVMVAVVPVAVAAVVVAPVTVTVIVPVVTAIAAVAAVDDGGALTGSGMAARLVGEHGVGACCAAEHDRGGEGEGRKSHGGLS